MMADAVYLTLFPPQVTWALVYPSTMDLESTSQFATMTGVIVF